jgi:hypothetical protein
VHQLCGITSENAKRIATKEMKGQKLNCSCLSGNEKTAFECAQTIARI